MSKFFDPTLPAPPPSLRRLVALTGVKHARKHMGTALAMKRAWAFLKEGKFVYTKIRGVAKVPVRQEALRRLLQYEPEQIRLRLVREPKNQHDPYAVQVQVTANGSKPYHIGYLSEKRAPWVATLLDEGVWVSAEMSQITGGSGNKKFGMNVLLEIDHPDLKIVSQPEMRPF